MEHIIAEIHRGEGRVTVEILQLNLPERIAERQRLYNADMLRIPAVFNP